MKKQKTEQHQPQSGRQQASTAASTDSNSAGGIASTNQPLVHKNGNHSTAPGSSDFENLPLELYLITCAYVGLARTPFNVSLLTISQCDRSDHVNLALVSKTLHERTLDLIYNTVHLRLCKKKVLQKASDTARRFSGFTKQLSLYVPNTDKAQNFLCSILAEHKLDTETLETLNFYGPYSSGPRTLPVLSSHTFDLLNTFLEKQTKLTHVSLPLVELDSVLENHMIDSSQAVPFDAEIVESGWTGGDKRTLHVDTRRTASPHTGTPLRSVRLLLQSFPDGFQVHTLKLGDYTHFGKARTKEHRYVRRTDMNLFLNGVNLHTADFHKLKQLWLKDVNFFTKEKLARIYTANLNFVYIHNCHGFQHLLNYLISQQCKLPSFHVAATPEQMTDEGEDALVQITKAATSLRRFSLRLLTEKPNKSHFPQSIFSNLFACTDLNLRLGTRSLTTAELKVLPECCP